MADPNSPSVAVPQALANSSSTSLSFPQNINNAAYYTRLTFYKYSRGRPNSNATETVRATIILPIPEGFGDAQSIDWGQEALGVYGSAADTLQNWTNQVQNGGSIFDAVKNSLNSINVRNARDAAVIAQVVTPSHMRDGKLQTIGSQILGSVVNPHLTATFNGVPLKEHTLNWKFAPRNAQEATALGKILSTIRIEALPSYDPTVSKYALDYPSTVTVEFNGVDQNYKPKIFKSAVLSMQTNLGPSGIAFYPNGIPVETEMTLQLRETEINTRNDFSNTATSGR